MIIQGSFIYKFSKLMSDSSTWQCKECTLQNSYSDICCVACLATCEAVLLACSDEKFVKKLPKNRPIIAGKYELWPHGVVVFREAIDEFLQEELVKDTMTKLTLRADMRAFEAPDAKGPPPNKGFEYKTKWIIGGDADKHGPEPACLDLAKNLYTQFRHVDMADFVTTHNDKQDADVLKLPMKFDAHSIWAPVYNSDTRLGFHQDPVNCHLAFVISIGQAIDFSYSRGTPNGIKPGIAFPSAADTIPNDIHGEQGLVYTIKLNSGDAIMFNGTVLFHAVTNFYDAKTLPNFWRGLNADFCRVGLQMREFMNDIVLSNDFIVKF
jgi:hypothetical protein